MAKRASSRGSRSRQSPARKTSSKKKKKTATKKKMAARPVKKKAGKKKAPRQVPPRPRPAPETTTRALPAPGREIVFAATEAGCLDQEVATAIVFGCIPGAVPLGTLLGTLFPSDAVRRGFCGCVFSTAREAGSIIGPGDVPCSAATSVGEVIDAISC